LKEDLVRYCRLNKRVCPMPHQWIALWEMLPNKTKVGTRSQPARPLILAAWHEAPALAKMLRLQEHIEWAAQHGVFDQVNKFLRSLPESEWAHLGEL
jgi:hypothetical protein